MKIKITYNVDEGFSKEVLATLPTEMDVPDDCDLDDNWDVKNVFDYVNDKVGVPMYEYEILPTKENAKVLWNKFSRVAVDDNGCIENDWYIFKAGDSKADIQKWFEAYFHVSVNEISIDYRAIAQKAISAFIEGCELEKNEILECLDITEEEFCETMGYSLDE